MQTKVSYPTAGFVEIFYIYISPSRKVEDPKMYLESLPQWTVV